MPFANDHIVSDMFGVLIGIGAVAVIYFIVFFVAKFSASKYYENKGDKNHLDQVPLNVEPENNKDEEKSEEQKEVEYVPIVEKPNGFVSFFYGINIFMPKDDVDCIVATFFDYTIKIELPSLNEIDGEMPFDQLQMIKDWAHMHMDELMKSLEEVKAGRDPLEIDSLE